MYREASPRDTPRTLVLHGKRTFWPLFAFVFLAPFLVCITRTELWCSRAEGVCRFHTSGMLGSNGEVALGRVSDVAEESDRGMMRPVLVLSDGSKTPLSRQTDTFVLDDKRALVHDFASFLSQPEKGSFDEAYGPSPVLVIIALGFAAIVVFSIVKSRERAVLVIDPRSDITNATFYPRHGRVPQRALLEHARLLQSGKRWSLFDERGTHIDLPRGIAPHALDTLRDVLGLNA